MFSPTILYRALVAAGARAASNFHTVAASSPTPTTSDSPSSSSSSFNNNGSSSSRLSSSYPQQQQQDSTSSSSSDYNNNDDQNNNSSSSSSSSSTDHQENQAAIQASATQLMRFRIPKPEQFYFSRGDSICRLCNEFVSSQQVKFHLVGAGPRGPSTHMGREIILDSLVYYGKLGYDPAVVMRSWAFTMLSHPQYVRLPELLPNKQDPTDLEARAKKCHELLQSLKKLKVIDISVSPHSEVGRTEHATRMAVKRRVAFERFECIGDNAWGSHLSGRMLLLFPDKKWAHAQMHHSFNTFRDLVETNTNLERCFDLLNIAELLPPTSRAIVGDGKIKADIFEAVLGELNCALYAHEANLWGTSEEYTELNDEHLARTCIIIKHVMNEIFDLTLLSMMYLLGEHAIGIARELSMGGIMNMNIAPSRPPFDAGDTIRTRRPHYHKNYVPTFTLPSVLQQLTDEPQYINNNTSSTCYRTHKINFKKYGPAINMTARSKCVPSWKSFVEQERRQKSLNEARILAATATTSTNSADLNQRSMMSLSEKPTTPPKGQRIVTTSTATTQPPLQQVFATNTNDGGSDPSSTSSSSSSSSLSNRIVDEGVILRELSSPSLDLCFGIQRHMSSGDNDTQSIIINNNNNNRNQAHHHLSSSAVEQAASTSSSSSSSGSSSSSYYRSLCPFTKLSKYPPHIYNPYGLDDKTWTDRWMKEEHAKEFFDDDVCDNIGTVLAQFEATAAFGNMMNTTSNSSQQQKGDDDYHAKREEEGKKLLRGSRSYEGMVDHVFDRLTVREEADEEEEEEANEELSSASASFYQNISYIRDELLEHIHPFKNGVTVGTDGASFTSLSGSITEVTTNLVVGRGESSSSSSSLSSSTTTSTTEDTKSKMTGTDQKPTVGGKLDIDEIKRRNAMRTGQKIGSVRRF